MTVVSDVWMELLILAASCLTIWKATRVSGVDSGNNGDPECQLTLFVVRSNCPTIGYHDMGTIYKDQWSMDR